jgi:hypothetical protein
MIKNIFFGLIALTFLFSACDEIEGPYTEVPDVGPVGDTIHTVVLFEFTGWECINCPNAHREIDKLHGVYGEIFQPISIHAGGFAAPRDEYDNDYRTDVGNELNESMNVQQYPIGAVNALTGDSLTSENSWGTKIFNELKKATVANIKMDESVSTDSTKISISLDIEFSLQLSGDYYVCAYMVENGIIGPQNDGGEIIEDYVHKHMLRASFNGTWGDKIATDPVKGFSVKKDYTLNLDSKWVVDSLHIIPFIYENSTKRVVPFNMIKEKK